MHRVFIDPTLATSDVIDLSERESHHLARVLRVREGEIVEGLDGCGHRVLAKVDTITKNSVTLRVQKFQKCEAMVPKISLFQAIPKGKNMEWIVEKATELGIYQIIPILSERTEVRPDKEARGRKVKKWVATAIDSIKQCGSPWLPLITEPLDISSALAISSGIDLSMVATFAKDARHPRLLMDEFARIQGKRPQAMAVWIGPEGDFTDPELTLIRRSGVHPITLGSLVLRAETAAIYSLSVLRYESQI